MRESPDLELYKSSDAPLQAVLCFLVKRRDGAGHFGQALIFVGTEYCRRFGACGGGGMRDGTGFGFLAALPLPAGLMNWRL